jgi:hypothetical protein
MNDMKNQTILFLSLLSFIFCFSCKSDSNALREELKLKSFQELMQLEIGEVLDDEIVLVISNQDLIEKFQAHSNQFNLEVNPTSVEVFTVGSNHYLRFKNSNSSVSTIALITVYYPNLEIPYIGVELGGTICTSLNCLDQTGCLPDGNYCTDCHKDANSNVTTSIKCTTSTFN